MSSLLAGCLPSSLTEAAAKAWQEEGVKGFEDVQTRLAQSMTPEQVAESLRRTKRLSEIIQMACVLPLLSNDPPDKVEFTDEWKAEAIEGLKLADPEFDESKFDPKEMVLDPRDIDDEDSGWLFSWAAGNIMDVEVKGGGTTSVTDLKRVSKPLARSSIAQFDEQKLRAAS